MVPIRHWKSAYGGGENTAWAPADARDFQSGDRTRRRYAGASTVGVWGWTDKPARWRTGRAASSSAFPERHVNGTLVNGAGDINLTFKRYLTSPIRMTLKDDYVTDLQGEGADANMMRAYLAAWATVKPMRCPMSASA